jgi:septum formation protein
LLSAGLQFESLTADVDETAIVNHLQIHTPDVTPMRIVQELAQAKASTVIEQLTSKSPEPNLVHYVVIGCDSMFEFAGELWGKPADAQVARSRIRQMQSNSGTLHTGYAVLSTTGAQALTTVSTVVHFAPMSEAQIDAYIATTEPANVAGNFTIDGYSSAFIAGVEGDFLNVVGISPNTIRQLLEQLGYQYTDFWK